MFRGHHKDILILLSLIETISLTYWLYKLLPWSWNPMNVIGAGIALFIFFLTQNFIFILIAHWAITISRNHRNHKNGRK